LQQRHAQTALPNTAKSRTRRVSQRIIACSPSRPRAHEQRKRTWSHWMICQVVITIMKQLSSADQHHPSVQSAACKRTSPEGDLPRPRALAATSMQRDVPLQWASTPLPRCIANLTRRNGRLMSLRMLFHWIDSNHLLARGDSNMRWRGSEHRDWHHNTMSFTQRVPAYRRRK
jgi:hypothetical protein